MRSSIVRHRWGGGLLLGLAVFLLSAGGASAASNIGYIQVGPLKTANGYKMTITGNCNAKTFPFLSARKSGRHYLLGQYYSDTSSRAASCKMSKKMNSVTLTMRMGKYVRGTLKFTKAGPLRREKLPKGCTGTIRQRKLESTGTLKISIHTKSFGKLVFHHVPALITGSGRESCSHKPSHSPTDVTLDATWNDGTSGFEASDISNQKSRILSVFARDNLSKQVRGGVSDIFYGGSKLFSFSSDLSSAKVGSVNRYLSGSLTYKALGACSTNGITYGTMSGKLVLKDPVSGKFSFPGLWVEYPSLQRSTGSC